jgi:plastocyanin
MPNMSPAPCTRVPSRRQVLKLGLAAALAPAAAAAAGKIHRVVITNMAFGPAPAALKVGDVIEWTNQDIFQHTATAKDGRFDVDLKPKANARIVLRKAGAVSVYCRYHPGMKLQLKIVG